MKHIYSRLLILSACLVSLAWSQQPAPISGSDTDITTMAAKHAPAVTSNTWTIGTPMHRGVIGPATAVLGGKIIYVVGGGLDWWTPITDTQIYDPASDTWRKGVPLPSPTFGAAAAVVNNVLYIFGGQSGTGVVSTVWAYSPQSRTWSSRSPMPTARAWFSAVVLNNRIYAIGGQLDDWTRLNNVERYNPATDTWTIEAPMLQGKSSLTAGVIGATIVAADGYSSAGDTGDNEGYNALANAWENLPADPTPRDGACAGTIGTQLYVASGYLGNGGTALPLTESFTTSNNTWATLADAPQVTLLAGSAVYNGRLYCFGGTVYYQGTPINNVQIYQP
jgi:N-acetylneuraminic acid mutarotase